MLYSEELWDKYVAKIEDGYKIKTYPHFDHLFDFPKRKAEIKSIVSDQKKVRSHAFLPFVKVIIKTPRFKYQGDSEKAGDLTAKERDEFYEPEIKPRPISFASHLDSYIYGFYSFALNEKYQDYIRAKGIDECIYAYRTDLNGKCNIQFAKEVFTHIQSKGNCTAIALDIKGYFDTIDHSVLKAKWCKVLGIDSLPEDQYKIFKSLTKYAYVNKNSILKHFRIKLKKLRRRTSPLLSLISDKIGGPSFVEKFELLRKERLVVINNEHEFSTYNHKRYYGIPQGSSMSAVLSNIYLVDFDEYFYKEGKRQGFFYRRYCDDILLVTSNEDADRVYHTVQSEIAKYHLRIQEKKTEIIDFNYTIKGTLRSSNRKKRMGSTSSESYKNLQYLGFEFNGTNCYVRPSSLSRYFRKMKGRIVKTIMMAYSPKSKSHKIFKQQIFHRYTHLGRRNFLTYAYNSSKAYYWNSKGEKKEGLNSTSIKRQLSNHFRILTQEIEKTSRQRAIKKGKLIPKK